MYTLRKCPYIIIIYNIIFCSAFSFLPYLSHPPWTALPDSGLNLAPVARLRSSWEKLPSKYEKLFGDLQDVFDPSRNMAKYRNILSSQSMQPPIIPLFPVVKKDLTFLHEGGNKTLFMWKYSDVSAVSFTAHGLLSVRMLISHFLVLLLQWLLLHAILRRHTVRSRLTKADFLPKLFS